MHSNALSAGNPAVASRPRPSSPRTSSTRPALWRLAVAASTAALLAGCSVGPDYGLPSLSLPVQWGSAETAPVTEKAAEPIELSRWWERLDDPILDGLIEQAVAGNLDVAAAKARIRQARAEYRQAGGALLPSIDASGSASRARSSSSTSMRSGDVSTQYKAGFDASWELDIFGQNRRALEAARYGLDAAEYDLRSTLLTMVGDIASNYVELRGYEARIDLARRTAESQRETAELTRVKYDAGTSSGLDVANATGQAISTEADLATYVASRAAALHRLGVLLGLAPAALEKRLAGTGTVPVPDQPVETGVPADILRARPDVRLAERQYAQATAKIGQAEAAQYPSITLTGTIATTAATLGSLATGTSVGWSLGPSLSLPIFNGGQLAAAVDSAEAQRDQNFVAYKAAVLTALEDVENAAVSLTQDRIRHARLEEAAANYREAARLARTRYQSGTSSFLDVLDAERSLYSVEDTLIQSRVAIATDYIALNKALGGGWDGEVDSSRPEIVDTDTGPRFVRFGQEDRYDTTGEKQE